MKEEVVLHEDSGRHETREQLEDSESAAVKEVRTAATIEAVHQQNEQGEESCPQVVDHTISMNTHLQDQHK